MSKEMTVIALGILVVVTPYLGIPGTWKTVILVLTGAAIAGIGFLLRGETLARQAGHGHDHFVENTAPLSTSGAGLAQRPVAQGRASSNDALATTPSPRDHGIGSLN
jgi:hypothetical protein